ncbi:response regulator transcription factor [Atopobiaceae bacterium HCP3S3_D6]
MANVYLVEDDKSVREQLSQLLAAAGHRVECAVRFDRLVDDIVAAAPDAVVLDLGLPGTDGQYVTRALRQASDVPVMVLTSRTSELDELMSLSMGADDFVAKSANPQLILAHLEALLRRRQPERPSTVSVGGLCLDAVRAEASYAGRTVELSRNELRILECLVRRPGAVVSREDLMEALWTTDTFVDDNTLTVNVARLRQTLARLGLPRAIVTHRGLGYSLRVGGGRPGGEGPAAGRSGGEGPAAPGLAAGPGAVAEGARRE